MLRVRTSKKVSAVHGVGLFAAEYIPRGTVVWRMDEGFDAVISRDQLSGLPGPAREQVEHYGYWDARRGAVVLCLDDARLFNHADGANCGDCPSEGPDVTVALRGISAGEELTWDYREAGEPPEPFWPDQEGSAA